MATKEQSYSAYARVVGHDAFGPVVCVYPSEPIRLNRPVLQFADDGHVMPHVRFGQRWSLPDGLEVAVLDVVTPRFIGRREDGVRVTGECLDLRKHGKLVVDVPQRSEREMIANTVYREAEFPPEGMTEKAWMAQMVDETEASATHRATRAGLYRVVSQGNGFASWNGALELTWPAPVVAPVVAPVEPVKVEPVAERPAVRVGQVWRNKFGRREWTIEADAGGGYYRATCDAGTSAAFYMLDSDDWQLVREAPKPVLSRKVEVEQVWRCVNTGEVSRIELVDGLLAVFAGRDRCVSMILMADGTPEYEHWERVS